MLWDRSVTSETTRNIQLGHGGMEWGLGGRNSVALSLLLRGAMSLGQMLFSSLSRGREAGWAKAAPVLEGHLPLAGLAGSVWPLILDVFIFILSYFFLRSLLCAHKCRFKICFLVLQHYLYYSIGLTALSTCLSFLPDGEPLEKKDQVTTVFIIPETQDGAWVMVSKQSDLLHYKENKHIYIPISMP